MRIGEVRLAGQRCRFGRANPHEPLFALDTIFHELLPLTWWPAAGW